VFRVVIPARYASTRLPGKALIPLAGKPMIEWVYLRSKASRASSVIIATDDPRITSAVLDCGAEVAMTSEAHTSGTDRIAEVARMKGWNGHDIVVNVQGDEPLMPPALIDQVAGLLEHHAGASVATLAAALHSEAELMDPNIVKVVTDADGRALYFSRAPIPWNRDDPKASFQGARRHVGIYAYRVSALLKLAALEPTPLEQSERLEQLRALENGMEIRVADSAEPPGADVNTPDDLQRAESILRQMAAATPR
jgi:3-deoxy-manno-octulosonate cytidylyltransferase (CMP-KDO synthetase)